LLNGCGCPKCATSKGEQRIADFLDVLNIQYERQKKFACCKNKRELPFDFYISERNMAIEYDGKQHFEPVDWGFHDEELMIANFNDLQKRDRIKNKYCEDNGIKLIRIAYTEFDNIEKILSENLS
jgi:very-short-patch-repair endonuclease